MRVKICGVNSQEAFDAACEAGADYIGFVFFAASPRRVTQHQIWHIARHNEGPPRVGLFVDPTDADIASTIGITPLDVLQVYCDARRARDIRDTFAMPVWRAVAVASRADLPDSAGGVDGFVIEPKPPADATRPGGNATALDWTLLAGWNAPVPWLLAGGLTPENVGEAIRSSGAEGVDVSSGVESAPGEKDPDAIWRFVAAARLTEGLPAP